MPKRISDEALAEVRDALEVFEREVKTACKEGRLHHSTSLLYLRQAETMLRWFKGDYEPGTRSKDRQA